MFEPTKSDHSFSTGASFEVAYM